MNVCERKKIDKMLREKSPRGIVLRQAMVEVVGAHMDKNQIGPEEFFKIINKPQNKLVMLSLQEAK